MSEWTEFYVKVNDPYREKGYSLKKAMKAVQELQGREDDYVVYYEENGDKWCCRIQQLDLAQHLDMARMLLLHSKQDFNKLDLQLVFTYLRV